MIPKKKKRHTPLPALIAKADKITSQYIRRKHADENGMVKCVSCETVLHWKDAHCAHWIGRAAKPTRWMEENLAPACPACNRYRPELHSREYTLVQLDRYGREGIEEIKALARQTIPASKVRELAEEAIREFGEALKRMEVV